MRYAVVSDTGRCTGFGFDDRAAAEKHADTVSRCVNRPFHVEERPAEWRGDKENQGRRMAAYAGRYQGD